jgi:hypothetical protein
VVVVSVGSTLPASGVCAQRQRASSGILGCGRSRGVGKGDGGPRTSGAVTGPAHARTCTPADHGRSLPIAAYFRRFLNPADGDFVLVEPLRDSLGSLPRALP